MTTMPPMDGGLHPDDELSAFVDGSLAPDEQAVIEAHVAACPVCQQHVEQLQAVRDIMRQLPLVDPPFGFFERTLRQGPKPRSSASRRLRNGLLFTIVALLAVLGVVLLVHHRPNEVTPDVGQVLHDYESVVQPVSVQPAAPATAQAADRQPSLEGYELVQVVDGEEGRYAVYRTGDDVVGVTWREGELDRERPDVPEGVQATPVEVDGSAGYEATAGDVTVLAIERGARVYIVVADAETEMEAISEQLPSPEGSTSITDQATSTGKALLETFGIGG